MNLKEQDNLLLELQALILAIAIALPLAIGSGVKSPMLMAIYIMITYFFISLLLNNISDADKKREKFKLVLTPQSLKMDYQNNNNLNSNGPGGIQDYGVMPKYEAVGIHKDCATPSTSNLKFPNSGPLDNLNCRQLKKNLQNLYNSTSHPYRDEINLEKESQNDKIISKDKTLVNSLDLNGKDDKYLKISKNAYPQLTKNQINASDCTNYQSRPMSCNQQPDSTNLFPQQKSILVSGCKSENDLKHIAREDFSVPASIQNTVIKPLFKNAPEGSLNSKDISNNLCGNCIIGECKYDICF